MTGFIRSQIKRKTFQHLAQHAALLCFALEYTLLMLDEYWGNFPIEYLLLFLQAALFCAALKTGPAPRQRPQKLLPRLWPVPLTAAVLILVYVLLPGRLWLVSSRVLGTALFLLGAFYWNRARSGGAAFLLNLYACGLAVHLCYLPLPIITVMFDIPASWISYYAAGAAVSVLLGLCSVLWAALSGKQKT